MVFRCIEAMVACQRYSKCRIKKLWVDAMHVPFALPVFRFVIRMGTRQEYSHVFGDLSTLCFFLDSVPQFILNARRGSVVGFSLSSVILELIGSPCLFPSQLGSCAL
jgi:hypothetical protein